jgi:amino acid adenylation domain-containing protein
LSSASSFMAASASLHPSPFAEQVPELCVHQLFEETARRVPQSVAVICEDVSLTYAELDARSSQLARVLREKGVRPDVLVGLCVERSADMVVGLLGILKAGGAYVPLDPAYPRDRIQYILNDAQVKVLVTQENLRDSLSATVQELVVLNGELATGEASVETTALPTPSNLAYVIYTSGSTGRPKGVQIEHRGVVNFLLSMQREPGLSQEDVLVAVTTLSFDIAGLEIYLPLITGARLVVATRESTQDGRDLAKLLVSSGATVMQATPATWRLLVESGWSGKSDLRIFCGGEALSPELARELVKRAQSVWNLYGPTETTIWSSVYPVRGDEERSIPIGHAIANTTLHVLGIDRELLTEGTEGELYIGGDGLARGYFNRPELTAEKFVPDPFSNVSGARMYRTGDLARIRANGNVEYLGRIDHQVKIRGFRIELGEIESVLEQHADVKQAIVVAREDRPGDKFLAAYFVSSTSKKPRVSDLREHLAQKLPDYMVPAAFVQLQSFPVTPNAKVDRKALPAPQAADFSNGEYIAPRNEVERKLVAMWEKILGISPIGVRTSFFDLGGRSILAARLFMQISRDFGKDVPLAALFEAPTIEQLTEKLREERSDFKLQTIVNIHPSGSRPPFFCVHGGTGGTLFLHRLARAMGTDQPFYAFQPQGVDGGRIDRTTIEAMASHYIVEMKKIQPEGPYFIGGYCFGGNVAFEMAKQLQQQGSSAGLVAMFSAPLRFNRPQGERPYAPERLPQTPKAHAPKTKFDKIRGAVRWRTDKLFYRSRTALHKISCRAMNAVGVPVPQKWRELYIVRSLTAAEKSYRPHFLDGKLVIFRGGGLYDHDPGMGWSKLASEIEDCVIGTAAEQRSRRDILNEPLVEKVAAQLMRSIDETRIKSEKPRPVAAEPGKRSQLEAERPKDAA